MTGAGDRGAVRPAPRSLAPALALALALGAAASAARADDLTGQADLSAASDESPVTRSTYLRQSYWLQYAHQVTQPLSYRLLLRYQGDRGTTTTGGLSSDLRSAGFSPSGFVDYRLDGFGLSASWALDRTGGLDPTVSSRLVWHDIQRITASSYLKPLEGLQASLSADRLAYSGAGSTPGTTDDRASLGLQYHRGALRISELNSIQRFTEGSTGLTRTTLGPRLSATYTQQLGPDWSMTGLYDFGYSRMEQQVPSVGSGVVAVEVQAVAGLYVNTNLPLDTSATPMVPDAALVDRSFGDSAGIPLGLDGTSFQNVGLDMGRFVQLDELRIHVRGASGVPVPFGGPVSWTMYSSTDGVRWAPVDGASSQFDPSTSAYVVDFPVATARYFKAVNFGVNTVETNVTELQAFTSEAVRAGRPQVSTALLQAFGVAVSGRLLPKLRLRYAGHGAVNGSTAYGGPMLWSNDFFNYLEGEVGPFGPVTLRLAQTLNTARQPAGVSQSSAGSSATLFYRPIERLETSVEARSVDTRIGGVSARTRGAASTVRADVYDSLQLGASAALNQQDLADGGTTRYVTGGGTASLRLTRGLVLDASAALQQTTSTRGDTSAALATPALRVIRYQRYAADLVYNPVSTLNVSAAFGWVSSDQGRSGVVQGYRVSWNPFSGGAVLLNVDYAEDVDPFTGDRLRRLTLFPQWTINRHTALQLNYAALRGGSRAAPIDQTSMFVTLRVSI